MAHFFVDLKVQLRYPFATTLTPNDEPFYIYFSQIDLNGSTMFVVIPVGVHESHETPFYAHGTSLRVIGPADVVGDTIFMKLPTLSTRRGRDCFPIMFQAVVAECKTGAFCATVPGMNSWPPAVEAQCTYHPNDAHVHDLADGDSALFDGYLVGFKDGALAVDVRTMVLDGKIPPYILRGSYSYTLSLAQQKAVFNWLRIYGSVCTEDELTDDPARCTALKTALATQDDDEHNPPASPSPSPRHDAPGSSSRSSSRSSTAAPTVATKASDLVVQENEASLSSPASPSSPRHDAPGSSPRSSSRSSTAAPAVATKARDLVVQENEASLSSQHVGVSGDAEVRVPGLSRIRAASI